MAECHVDIFLALVALKSRIMAVKGMQATLHGAVYKL